MRIRTRYVLILALAAAGALTVGGIALAAPSSTFTFEFSPNKVPKKNYKPGKLATDLITSYTNPGNNNPGGAVERTQIFLDKNFKIDNSAAKKCDKNQLSGATMAQAMAACKKALVGKGIASATANGLFKINGCVLLFNGKEKSGNPTLLVFTRVNAQNPSTISCNDPANNNQGNATVLLEGVLKGASGKFGKVLDVDHITDAAAFPLEQFKTKIGKADYFSARCKAADKTWYMKTTWTYNDDTKKTVNQDQKCKVA